MWVPDKVSRCRRRARILKVDQYAAIRRAHRDGMSIREIARRFGHSRKSIRKALASAEPEPYRRKGPWPTPKFTAELKRSSMRSCWPMNRRRPCNVIWERASTNDCATSMVIPAAMTRFADI